MMDGYNTRKPRDEKISHLWRRRKKIVNSSEDSSAPTIECKEASNLSDDRNSRSIVYQYNRDDKASTSSNDSDINVLLQVDENDEHLHPKERSITTSMDDVSVHFTNDNKRADTSQSFKNSSHEKKSLSLPSKLVCGENRHASSHSLPRVSKCEDGVRSGKRSSISRLFTRLASSIGSLTGTRKIEKQSETSKSAELIKQCRDINVTEQCRKKSWQLHLPTARKYEVSPRRAEEKRNMKDDVILRPYYMSKPLMPSHYIERNRCKPVKALKTETSNINSGLPNIYGTTRIFPLIPSLPTYTHQQQASLTRCNENSWNKQNGDTCGRCMGSDRSACWNHQNDLQDTIHDTLCETSLKETTSSKCNGLKSRDCEACARVGEDDEVFLPNVNVTKTFVNPALSFSAKPLKVHLRDNYSLESISETDLRFLSDSSSSTCSSANREPADYSLPVFLQPSNAQSTCSDITDVTSMTSYSTISEETFSGSYQENNSCNTDTYDLTVHAVMINNTVKMEERQDSVGYGTDDETIGNCPEAFDNKQHFNFNAVVSKQPSFGALERDFNDFVINYNARKKWNDSNTNY